MFSYYRMCSLTKNVFSYRALDTQCFVVAACPANDKRLSAPFHR